MLLNQLRRKTFLTCVFLPLWFTTAYAADEVDFANDIQPLLARKCYSCHGPDLQEGSIRFDDRSTLLVDADSGFHAIAPGSSKTSEMIRRVSEAEDWERMPPEGKPLTEEEVQKLAQWIDAGANYETHWAFQPVQKYTPPQVKHPEWVAEPIDSFVVAKLEAAGLEPVGSASPEALIRRVYLDTIGVPPAPETVTRLLKDWSDDKYIELVDQLLADPAFGDRWARTWLDVVRYAETNSYERDNAKPNAWKYRDYVIRAFNDDKPYNQFVLEQLAGDELDHVTADSLTATGYYRLGLWDDEPADPKQAQFDGFDDLVTTTSQGFLGLTLNCARCHDHKIDPLTQKDYYSMVAFMRDVTPYGTRGDQTSNNQVDLDPEVAAQYDRFAERDRELKQLKRELEQAAIVKMPAPDQRATEGRDRAKVLREKMQQYVDDATWVKYENIKSELTEIDEKRRALPPRERVLGLGQVENSPKDTFLLMRGSPHAEGDVVEPTFPRLLGGGRPDLEKFASVAESSGRRRALAEWIASDDNWMTARVIVNRIWLQYFGRGIVRSPNNFGLMGDPPSHPQLLDFLATQLIRGDWHLKSIHRQILLSNTYRRSSQHAELAAAEDPANNLFWRQNLKRLSAEQVRDSVLAVTGSLNEQRYGESMYPTLSQEVLASQSQPGRGWGNSAQRDQARRSIYIHVKRSLPVPLLSAFDFPETDVTCEARFLTTQPGQALTMLNSDWMQEQAKALLHRVEREVGGDVRSQAARALELAISQPADPADVDELVDLVARLSKRADMNDRTAREAMCLVTLNLNAFFYID